MTPSRVSGAIRGAFARWRIELSMLAAIGIVVAAATWSATVERRDALSDFSHAQTLLATMVGVDFEHRLAERYETPTASTRALVDDAVLELMDGARHLETKGELMVLVARPGQAGFLATDGRLIPSAHIRAAVDAGERALVLPREEAVSFGLPRRMAVAGLRQVDDHDGKWAIAVLASAQRIRNRDTHEAWRLGLTALVVTALGAGFGVLTRRRQRRELELEREVAVTSLEREREALLAKADKMATLAALSTGIAHELGTPLGVIVGRVEQTVARVEDDPRSVAALGIVLDQVGRIHAIARGCLALARGDRPHLVPTPPRTIAKHAVDLVMHRFRKADVELTWEVDAGLPDVACEPSLIEQALVNVLLNACQATPAHGTVSLRVSAVEGRVAFVVDDDGAGISEAVAERATEPFFSTKRDEGGSGLGLTIAREIVSHHAGSLTLTRREGGVGTRATITLGS